MFKKISVKTFVAAGIGAALFFVLGKFAAIPVFANTTICFQYAILAFFAVLYGPICGVLVGFVGHALIDFTSYGPWWSWIVTSALVGLLIGVFTQKMDVESGELGKKSIFNFIIAVAAANAVGWVAVAPTLDILIYSEPANKVYIQGLIAFASNSVTSIVIGLILLIAYSKTRTKKGSLTQD